MYAICNTPNLLNLTLYGEYKVLKLKQRKVVIENNEGRRKAYAKKHFYPIKE